MGEIVIGLPEIGNNGSCTSHQERPDQVLDPLLTDEAPGANVAGRERNEFGIELCPADLASLPIAILAGDWIWIQNERGPLWEFRAHQSVDREMEDSKMIERLLLQSGLTCRRAR